MVLHNVDLPVVASTPHLEPPWWDWEVRTDIPLPINCDKLLEGPMRVSNHSFSRTERCPTTSGTTVLCGRNSTHTGGGVFKWKVIHEIRNNTSCNFPKFSLRKTSCKREFVRKIHEDSVVRGWITWSHPGKKGTGVWGGWKKSDIKLTLVNRVKMGGE